MSLADQYEDKVIDKVIGGYIRSPLEGSLIQYLCH